MFNRNTMLGAASVLLLTTGIAAAAPARVATDLNVRAGQGTNYPVIGVLPAGAIVDVSGCGDGWCYVRDYGGYASASYLNPGAAAYGYSVVVPAPVYEPYYYDPGPRIGFGVGFGNWGRHYHRDRDRDRARERRRDRFRD